MLRDYQKEALEAVRLHYDMGFNRLLGHAATGLGKGYLIPELADYFPELFEHGMFINCHRREIAKQIVRHFKRHFPTKRVGLEMAQHHASDDDDIVVAMIPTLGREATDRIMKFRRPRGIIVSDECHHISDGGTWDNVLNFHGVGSDVTLHGRELPGGLLTLSLGLTATPQRNDNKSLGVAYDEVAFSYDIRYGVRNGWLTDIKAYQVREQDTEVRNPEEVLDYEVNLTVKSWLEFGLNLKTLVFAQSVAHSREIMKALKTLGIEAAHVDGETPSDERDFIVENFANGNIRVVTNFGVFTEGFDDPGIQAIVMARSVGSEPLYVQMMGRGLRPSIALPVSSTPEQRRKMIADSDKPVCHVLDLVWNTSNLSLITVPSLFGINPEFNAAGHRVIEEIVDVIEEAEAEAPERPIRDVKSIEEIEITVSAVDIWNGTVYNDEIRQLSPLRWIHEDEHYSLYLPSNPVAKRAYDKVPQIIRFEKREGNLYEELHIEVGGWVETPRGKFPRKAKVTSKGVFPETELPIRMKQKDRWVAQNDETLFKKLRRDFVDAHKPLTEGTRKVLKQRGIKIPDGLTEINAQILIDADKIHDKMEKLK